MSPFMAEVLAAALWMYHPGVPDHIASLGPEGHYASEALPGTERFEGLCIALEIFERNYPTKSTREEHVVKRYDQGETPGWLLAMRDRRTTIDQVDAPRLNILDRDFGGCRVRLDFWKLVYSERLAFIASHLDFLDAAADSNLALRQAAVDARRLWEERTSLWSLLVVALSPSLDIFERRMALHRLREGLGPERFAQMRLPDIWGWGPDAFKNDPWP